MQHSTGFYPSVHVDDHGRGVVSQAGATVLLETIKTIGLEQALSRQLRPRMKPLAFYDPAKILLDQVVSLATGGDCLSDVDRFRDQPGQLFGHVASNPTVSRLITQLAGDSDKALAAINRARTQVRAHVWETAGLHSPVANVTVDVR